MQPSESHLEREPEPELMDLAEEAEAYDRADFAAVNDAFVARLVELAGDADAALVDLGCGPGDMLIRMARAQPGWRIVGVEAADAMIALARKNVAAAGVQETVKLVRGDAKNTGLEGGCCDIVTSNSLLHQLPDPLPLWREIRRLAHSDSLVLLRDLYRPIDRAAAQQIVQHYAGHESSLLQEEFFRSLLAAFTTEEVRSQLAAVGLEELEVRIVTDRHLDVVGRIR